MSAIDSTVNLAALRTLLSARDIDLVADAIALLWTKPAFRAECLRFAADHPELGLFYDGAEPEPEEDR